MCHNGVLYVAIDTNVKTKTNVPFQICKMLLNLEDLQLKVGDDSFILRRFERTDWKQIGKLFIYKIVAVELGGCDDLVCFVHRVSVC